MSPLCSLCGEWRDRSCGHVLCRHNIPSVQATRTEPCEPVAQPSRAAGSLFPDAHAASAAGQSSFDAGEAATNSGPFGPVPFPHSSIDTPKVQHDHA